MIYKNIIISYIILFILNDKQNILWIVYLLYKFNFYPKLILIKLILKF